MDASRSSLKRQLIGDGPEVHHASIGNASLRAIGWNYGVCVRVHHMVGWRSHVHVTRGVGVSVSYTHLTLPTIYSV